MTWEQFIDLFTQRFLNQSLVRHCQDEFSQFRQRDLSVAEVIRQFNRLARLCPTLVPTEEERVRRMMNMFRPAIVKYINTSVTPPVTVADCVDRALQAEFHGQKARDEYWARKNNKRNQEKPNYNQHMKWGQKHNNNQGRFKGNQQGWFKEKRQRPDTANESQPNKRTAFTCPNCKKRHLGECLKGTGRCFTCGEESHKSMNCPKRQTPTQA